MWRGAMPLSTKVGQVERASVGWAMYFSGLARMRLRNSSRSAWVEAGPMSIP